jgi:hypothetical protein
MNTSIQAREAFLHRYSHPFSRTGGNAVLSMFARFSAALHKPKMDESCRSRITAMLSNQRIPNVSCFYAKCLAAIREVWGLVSLFSCYLFKDHFHRVKRYC